MNTVAVCQECDSEDLSATGYLLWDKDKGDWLSNPNDELHGVWCFDCDGECIVDYITEEELKLRQVKGRLLSSKGVYNIDLYKGMDAGAIYKKLQGDV